MRELSCAREMHSFKFFLFILIRVSLASLFIHLVLHRGGGAIQLTLCGSTPRPIEGANRVVFSIRVVYRSYTFDTMRFNLYTSSVDVDASLQNTVLKVTLNLTANRASIWCCAFSIGSVRGQSTGIKGKNIRRSS